MRTDMIANEVNVVAAAVTSGCPAPKPQRKKRRARSNSDGSVTKRCRHDRTDWDLCGCPFYYYVTHRGRKHRGKIPGVASMEQARTAYALIAANVRNGRAPLAGFAPAGDGLTVSQLADEWLSAKRDRKDSTIDAYRDHVRAQINPVLGNHLVTAVTPEDCERLVLNAKSTRHKGRELCVKSKKGIARTLHTLFQFAILRRKRKDNPATLLTKVVNDPDASPDDDVIDPKDHTKYFTSDEAQHLLAVCREKFPEWYAWVLTGLETGVRLGELRMLSFAQVNFRAGTLTVDRAWVQGRRTTPKNRKSRSFKLSRHLLTALRARRLWRKDRACDLVFPSSVGTPLETSHIARFWKSLLEAAELGYRTRHAMRHTHSTLLLQAGVPIARVAAVAGRSIEVTARIYYHWLPQAGGDDAEVLAGLLTGQTPRTHVSATRAPAATNRRGSATTLRVASRK